MTDFEKYQATILSQLEHLDVAISDDDNGILNFISSIKDFRGTGQFKSGIELIAFVSQLHGYDTAHGFVLNDIFYVMYRFGKVGDSGYYLWVAKKPTLLIDYFKAHKSEALDADAIKGIIEWLDTWK